jgi:hypothetical protein
MGKMAAISFQGNSNTIFMPIGAIKKAGGLVPLKQSLYRTSRQCHY